MRHVASRTSLGTFGILSLLVLCGVASIPQTQANSVIEKFPTSTSVVVAGWNYPENAYAEDGNSTESYTNNAQQEYADFGFNFNATNTIDKVRINLNGVFS